jgi:uncharacterized membrane protein YccC
MSTAAPGVDDARAGDAAPGAPDDVPAPGTLDTADAALAAYAELLGKQIAAASEGDLDGLEELAERRRLAGQRLDALLEDPSGLDPVMVARVRELDRGLRAQLRRMRRELRERLDELPGREEGLRRYLEVSDRVDADERPGRRSRGPGAPRRPRPAFHRGQGNLDVRG